MRIYLLKDVPNVGQKGSIKSVKDGFARNLLIPRGLAKIADVTAVKEAEEKNRLFEEETAELREKLQGLAGREQILQAALTGLRTQEKTFEGELKEFQDKQTALKAFENKLDLYRQKVLNEASELEKRRQRFGSMKHNLEKTKWNLYSSLKSQREQLEKRNQEWETQKKNAVCQCICNPIPIHVEEQSPQQFFDLFHP